MSMTDHEKDVKLLAKKWGTINASLVAKAVDVHYGTAAKLLQRMADEGKLERSAYKVNERWKTNYRLPG